MPFAYKVRPPRYCFDPKKHGPDSKEPYAVSRSRIDLFMECPRCFWIGERWGIKRPDSYPLTLNVAVDELLKKEFDLLRKEEKPHPLMKKYKINAVPFAHKDLDIWRDSLKNGIKYHDPDTNLIIRGGIDDVWVNEDGELHIVDYKATSKRGEVNLDAEWQDGYKRQIEVYQWLFRQNGFTVSDTAYFVYVNGDADAEKFDGKLMFDSVIIPYEGNDSWIKETVRELHTALMDEYSPKPSSDCPYCAYRKIAGEALLNEHRQKQGKIG